MSNDRTWWAVVLGFLLFGLLMGTLLFGGLPFWVAVKPWLHLVAV